VAAATELSAALPDGVSLPRPHSWIVAQPGVTAVIPGARTPAQATANAAAASALDDPVAYAAFDAAVHEVYDRRLRGAIHPQW
jgi:hypothetical protein